jgi:hypothetical protein
VLHLHPHLLADAAGRRHRSDLEGDGRDVGDGDHVGDEITAEGVDVDAPHVDERPRRGEPRRVERSAHSPLARPFEGDAIAIQGDHRLADDLGGYGWAVEPAEQYIELLVEIAEASGGGLVEPGETVTDCPDHEDNRILECAAASGSVLIGSDDSNLIARSPWQGTSVVTSSEFVKRTDAMRRARRR